MKTVQETLKEINKDELIGVYLFNYPIDLNYLLFKNPEVENLTIKELGEKFRKKISRVIDRLATIQTVPQNPAQQGILYAHRVIKDGFPEPETELILMGELLEKGAAAAQPYAYFFTQHEEIAGYLIADTPYTQDNLYSLLADVIHEASFFGVEQEYLADEIKKLEKSKEDIDKGNYHTAEEVISNLREKYGLEEDRDEETEEESQLRNLAAEKEYEYSRMTAAREKEAIVNNLTAGA